MYSNQQSKILFNTDVKFDLIVHHDIPRNKKTAFVDYSNEKHMLRLHKFTLLPNYNIQFLKKMFKTSAGLSVFKIIRTTKYNLSNDYVGETKYGAYKYPIIHKITEEGPQIYYSTTKSHGIFGVPKIIIGTGKYPYPIFDPKGHYAITSNVFAISFSSKQESEFKHYVHILKSKDFYQHVILPTRFTHFSIHHDIFSKMNKNIVLDLFRDMTLHT